MITVVIDQIHIHISLPEQDMGNKLDAITAAIADVKNEVTTKFDELATAVSGELERLATKLAGAIDASTGSDTALAAEVQGAVDGLSALKQTVDDKVGTLKTALDGIDGVVGNIDGTAPAALTLTADVAASVSPQTVGISNSSGLTAGQSVTVDVAPNAETVVLTAVPSTSEIAGVFTLAHAVGAVVAAVPAAQ